MNNDPKPLHYTWYCAPLYEADISISCSQRKKKTTSEAEDLSEPMEASYTLDQTTGGTFLSLDELGELLLYLASKGQCFFQFSKYI